MKTKSALKLILATIMFVLVSGSAMAQSTKKIYTFGIVPQQAAAKLARKWAPIFKLWSKENNFTIQFRTAPNIPEFEKRLSKGEYDFSYMNPYHFTVVHESPGYEAVAKAKDKRIKGIMIVKKDSNLNTMSQLNNTTLAFPSPAAFAASILSRAHLKNNNIKFTPKYVSSHDSVYRSVAKGLYPSGGGVIRTFNNTEPAIRKQLKVLWTSNAFTPHAIAAHPRVSKEDVKNLLQSLLKMDSNPRGKKLLKGISLKGFVAAKNSDWDDVRSLGIDVLKELVK